MTVRLQRSPIYVGGEGASETGYSGWLRGLVLDQNLPFHLHLDNLGKGAGDPLARIELALERIEHWNRNREPFVGKYLFLDADQLKISAQRAQQARRLAGDNGFLVIWQEPTHEAFLLRHIHGCQNKRPPDKRSADKALVREWPEYVKPQTALQIEAQLDLAGAQRVARHLPELEHLLKTLGLWVDGYLQGG